MLGNNLPEGFKKGFRTIPKGREFNIGFHPADDQPDYVKEIYRNNRDTPKKRKEKKQERGYFTPKHKK